MVELFSIQIFAFCVIRRVRFRYDHKPFEALRSALLVCSDGLFPVEPRPSPCHLEDAFAAHFPGPRGRSPQSTPI